MRAWLTRPRGRHHKAPPPPCALTTTSTIVATMQCTGCTESEEPKRLGVTTAVICDNHLAGAIPRSDRAYFISGLGGRSRPTGPQADFERPGVSPLRSGVTTAQSGRVVRWTVGGAFRATAAPTRERPAVWSWHVPKSAPWLVGRGGNEPH